MTQSRNVAEKVRPRRKPSDRTLNRYPHRQHQTLSRSSLTAPGAGFDPGCQACPRLAGFLEDVRHEHPDYFAAPVPPFGDPAARLLIVGLAPGMHGANRTGRPFTGDYAGLLLYRTLYRYGLASADTSKSADDGLRLSDIRFTNAVKCLPPQNKPNSKEINTCNQYLKYEIENSHEIKAILALGRIAHDAVLRALDLRRSEAPFAHSAVHPLRPGLTLVDSYHCSRYNLNTGRLTEAMFDTAFRRFLECVRQ